MLDNVEWFTTDVHNLMSCLSLTKLGFLAISPACHLKYGPPSTSLISNFDIYGTEIQASLTIDVLLALLSKIRMERLLFCNKCQVLDMSLCPSEQSKVGRLIVYINLIVYTYYQYMSLHCLQGFHFLSLTMLHHFMRA